MHGADLIGHRFRLGATGEDGFIDCINMVFRTHEAMGIPVPPLRDEWYRYDMRDILRSLRWWMRINDPGRDGDALVYFDDGVFSFGVVTGGGLLHIDRVSDRVAWMPCHLFAHRRRWYRYEP